MARILVVEDNPQNLKLTTVILNAGGHTVVPAHDSDEAENALASGNLPDLIIMDLALPGKDGYALTKELRLRSDTARLPILAVSSFAMPGDAERAIAAGCTQYLTKPVRRAALLERVDTLLAAGSSSSQAVSNAPKDPPATPEAASQDPRASKDPPVTEDSPAADDPPISPDPAPSSPAAAEPAATPPSAPAAAPPAARSPASPTAAPGPEPPPSSGLGP